MTAGLPNVATSTPRDEEPFDAVIVRRTIERPASVSSSASDVNTPSGSVTVIVCDGRVNVDGRPRRRVKVIAFHRY